MEQVSGRAGRKNDQGKVVVQVSNLKHPVLQFVKAHDYTALFQLELENRKQFDYPPFTRLIRVHFKHKEKHISEEAAQIFANGLKAQFANHLMGPSQPVVDRIRNQYIWEILIKLPKDNRLIHICKIALQQQTIILQTHKRYRSVHVVTDVDPN